MTASIVQFTLDSSGAEAKFRSKGDAIADALAERTTAISTALQAKIAGQKLQGEVLKSHTNKLAGSVRVMPTIAAGTQISGGVQAGGGVVNYAKALEDGSVAHVIMPKDPKGALAFSIGGKLIFRKRVMHPGTRAYLYMKGTLAEEQPNIIESYQQAANEAAQ